MKPSDVIAYLVGAAVVLLVWFGLPKAGGDQTSTLDVSGQGSVQVPVTKLEGTVSIVAQEKTTDDLNNLLAQRSAALLNFLKAENAENVRTDSVQISPHIDFVKGVQTPNGFDGRVAIHFETGVKNSGELISGALRSGASEMGGLNPIFSDADLDGARKQALAAAVADALAKAQATLDAAGLKRKAIRHLSVDFGGAAPMAKAMLAFSGAAQRSIPVEGGDREVTANVQATLEIAPK